jgi:hypothetical protein
MKFQTGRGSSITLKKTERSNLSVTLVGVLGPLLFVEFISDRRILQRMKG